MAFVKPRGAGKEGVVIDAYSDVSTESNPPKHLGSHQNDGRKSTSKKTNDSAPWLSEVHQAHSLRRQNALLQIGQDDFVQSRRRGCDGIRASFANWLPVLTCK